MRHSVHLHVVKVHFVIGTSVNLKEMGKSRFLVKKKVQKKTASRRKKRHCERVNANLRDQDADLAARGVTSDRRQGSQIGNLVAQIFSTAVSFGISLNATPLDRN